MNEKEIGTLIEKALSEEASLGWQRLFLALLDWPFLLFIFLFVFLLLFKQKIIGILERGDIQIAWGKDRHIKLRELSDGIDGEIDPLREEIAQIKEELAKAKISPTPGKIEIPNFRSPEEDEKVTDLIIGGLKSHKYRWRSTEKLASLAGIPELRAVEILRSVPNIVLSTAKSGLQIARLEDR